MTADIPDFLPSLRRGAGRRPAEGGCLVQVASMLHDGRSWTDRPDCVHPVLREVAVRINDRMPDGDRDRLYPFAPDLIGTHSPDAALAARLALWCARDRLPVLPGSWRAVAERAVAAGEQHLAGQAGGHECRLTAVSAYRLAVGVDYEERPAMLAAAHAAYAAFGARAGTPARMVFGAGKRPDRFTAAVRAADLACEVVGPEPVDMIAFLAGVLAEHQRLTRHDPPAVVEQQWALVQATVRGRAAVGRMHMRRWQRTALLGTGASNRQIDDHSWSGAAVRATAGPG